jgi:hypothetical protein
MSRQGAIGLLRSPSDVFLALRREHLPLSGSLLVRVCLLRQPPARTAPHGVRVIPPPAKHRGLLKHARSRGANARSGTCSSISLWSRESRGIPEALASNGVPPRDASQSWRLPTLILPRSSRITTDTQSISVHEHLRTHSLHRRHVWRRGEGDLFTFRSPAPAGSAGQKHRAWTGR